jgi:hypothetical protein
MKRTFLEGALFLARGRSALLSPVTTPPSRSARRCTSGPECEKVSDSGSLVLPVAHHAQNGETQRVRHAVLGTWCDYGFVAGFFIMDVIDV